MEFGLCADESDGAVVEEDAAALGVVVVEGEQLGPAVARLVLGGGDLGDGPGFVDPEAEDADAGALGGNETDG